MLQEIEVKGHSLYIPPQLGDLPSLTNSLRIASKAKILLSSDSYFHSTKYGHHRGIYITFCKKYYGQYWCHWMYGIGLLKRKGDHFMLIKRIRKW